MVKITQSIKLIVTQVVNNGLNINMDVNSKASFDKPDIFIDHKKDFKDILTDLITNEYLRSKDKNLKFLELIFNTFNASIEYYTTLKNIDPIKIKFVYKGGNVLRLMAFNFMYELPGIVIDTIKKEYGPFFKKSDADFSIMIDSSIDNYEQVRQELRTIAYYMLDYIRKILSYNLSSYFDYFMYNDEIKKQLLQKTLNDLNTSIEDNAEYKNDEFKLLYSDNVTLKHEYVNKYIHNPTNRTNYGGGVTDSRTDFYISVDTDPRKLSQTAINSKQENKIGQFYISINDALEFDKDGTKTHFDLVRMKINFKTIYGSKNNENEYKSMLINGELIDVSIPLKDDSFVDKNKGKSFDEKYFSGNYENRFRYNIISLHHSIDDLENILFYQHPLPWDASKYEKRISRLLFLYLIDLLYYTPSLNIDNLRIYINDLDHISKSIGNVLKVSAMTDLNTTMNYFIKFVSTKKDKNIKLYKFIPKLILIITKVQSRRNDTVLDKNSSQFFTTCVNELNKLKNIIKILKQFMETHNLDKNNLYKIESQDGGNNYLHKYTKYKSKYNNLKYSKKC
jgi:hypothetical protein